MNTPSWRFLVTFLCCIPIQVWGFSVALQNNYTLRWNRRNVSFYLDADGTRDITTQEDAQAIQRAIQSWNNVACSDFTLQQVGTITHTNTIVTTNRTDGQNAVVWIEDNRWTFGSYVLAVTTPVFDNNGRISEADISFNGYQTRWSTNLSQAGDVESVAVHEFGHFFGLQHVLGGESMAEPPTMAPFADPYGKTRSLTPDDQQGLCYLYPSPNRYTCTQNSQCPRFVDTNDQGQEFYSGTSTCNAGTCSGSQSLPQGTLPIGSTCSDPYECASGLFCQATNLGSVCTQTCTPQNSNTCPTGFRCLPYPQSTDGACIANTFIDDGSNTSPGGTTPSQPTPPTENTPAPNTETPSSPPGCACDQYLECESSCTCDPDCVCACDTTTACDKDCTCDPECRKKKKGCAALPTDTYNAGHAWTLWALCLCAIMLRRAKKHT
jgi:hypothetical protein